MSMKKSIIGILFLATLMLLAVQAEARHLHFRPPFLPLPRLPVYWSNAWLPIWISTSMRNVPPGYGYLDLDVAPERAKVFIDGRYVGICDHFDGFPTFLYLKPGRYTIRFELEGYHSYQQTIDVEPGREIEFNTRLRRGSDAYEPPNRDEHRHYTRDNQYDNRAQRPGPHRSHTYDRSTPSHSTEQHSRSYEKTNSSLSFRIEPRQSSVYIDGAFKGLASDMEASKLPIAPGTHTVEIVMPGYEVYRAVIEVKAGQSTVIRAFLNRVENPSERSDETIPYSTDAM